MSFATARGMALLVFWGLSAVLMCYIGFHDERPVSTFFDGALCVLDLNLALGVIERDHARVTTSRYLAAHNLS